MVFLCKFSFYSLFSPAPLCRAFSRGPWKITAHYEKGKRHAGVICLDKYENAHFLRAIGEANPQPEPQSGAAERSLVFHGLKNPAHEDILHLYQNVYGLVARTGYPLSPGSQ